MDNGIETAPVQTIERIDSTMLHWPVSDQAESSDATKLADPKLGDAHLADVS